MDVAKLLNILKLHYGQKDTLITIGTFDMTVKVFESSIMHSAPPNVSLSENMHCPPKTIVSLADSKL